MQKKNIYLGIDVGGTNIRLALLRGLHLQQPLTAKFRTPRTIHQLEKALAHRIQMFLGNQRNLAGIGVGLAGIADRKKRVAIKIHNIAFLEKWNPTQMLAEWRAPVKMDNDVRCFLRAESAWGAARQKMSAVGIAIGTGIGGAIIVNGRLLYGAHGSAGEVGFLVLNEKKPKFFEDLAALDAYKRYGDRSKIIGLGIASLINALDPEIVVMGGGAVTSKDFHLQVIRKIARRHIINPLAKETPIVKGTLGDFAQAIGAALLFAPKTPVMWYTRRV